MSSKKTLLVSIKLGKTLIAEQNKDELKINGIVYPSNYKNGDWLNMGGDERLSINHNESTGEIESACLWIASQEPKLIAVFEKSH